MTDRGQNVRALTDALRSARLATDDGAAVQLARRYAQLLDQARGRDDEAAVYHTLGPKYLATLTALGLTRAGRDAAGGDDAGSAAGRAALDELRQRRRARGAG